MDLSLGPSHTVRSIFHPRNNGWPKSRKRQKTSDRTVRTYEWGGPRRSCGAGGGECDTSFRSVLIAPLPNTRLNPARMMSLAESSVIATRRINDRGGAGCRTSGGGGAPNDASPSVV